VKPDRDRSREDLGSEIALLRETVQKLEKQRPLTREQKLKLAILDKAPFTLWACDRDFNIVLWEGKCSENYCCPSEHAIGSNYLELFVDPLEREESQKWCVEIIDHGAVQRNCLATDTGLDGKPKTMLTNCFRIRDEENDCYLQAEVALEINDYDLKKQEYHELRELARERRGLMRQNTELQRNALLSRIETAHYAGLLAFHKRRDVLTAWSRRVEAEQGKGAALALTSVSLSVLDRWKDGFEGACGDLKTEVNAATTNQKLTSLDSRVNSLRESSSPPD
jgi:hypothetical protein